MNSKKENYVQFGLCIGTRQIYSILGVDANKQITGSCPFPLPEHVLLKLGGQWTHI